MVKVDTRIAQEDRDSIQAIADDLYDGNFSMALRKVIQKGLGNGVLSTTKSHDKICQINPPFGYHGHK
jgi:hypothetical protein